MAAILSLMRIASVGRSFGSIGKASNIASKFSKNNPANVKNLFNNKKLGNKDDKTPSSIIQQLIKSGDIFNITDIQSVWNEKNFASGGKPKKITQNKKPAHVKTSKKRKKK